MAEEKWKDVAGYAGRYQISDRGRIRSLNYHQERRVQELRPGLDTKGYPQVELYENGIRKMKKVHTLVLEAFVGARPKGLVCDHIDAVKTNNRVENLRWITNRENIRRGRAPEAARMICGSKCWQAKITERQVIIIRNRYAAGGVTQRELGEKYGLAKSSINQIIHRRTWKKVA